MCSGAEQKPEECYKKGGFLPAPDSKVCHGSQSRNLPCSLQERRILAALFATKQYGAPVSSIFVITHGVQALEADTEKVLRNPVSRAATLSCRRISDCFLYRMTLRKAQMIQHMRAAVVIPALLFITCIRCCHRELPAAAKTSSTLSCVLQDMCDLGSQWPYLAPRKRLARPFSKK